MCLRRLERVSARSGRGSRPLDASVSAMIAWYLIFGAAEHYDAGGRRIFTCEIIPFREFFLYFIPHVAGQSFTRLSGYMTLYKKSLLLSLSHHLQKTQTISGINTFFSIIHSSTL